jgi:hypothetical protein
MNLHSHHRHFAALLLVYSGLGLWLGSIIFFGIGVTAPVFKLLPSKDLAGTLNGVILHRLNILEHVAAAMLLAGLLLAGVLVRDWRRGTPFALALIMTVLLAYYAHYITPAMEALKVHINSFDTPNAASMRFVQEFRSWHVVYSRLVSANLVLGLVLFIWQTWLVATPPSASDAAISSSSIPHEVNV